MIDFKTSLKKVGSAFRSFWSAPDVVQKAGILGAGLAIYPLVIWMIMIVWKGGWAVARQSEQLDILGKLAFGLLGLLALVIVALLGVVKGIKADLPGGASIDLDLEEDKPPGDDNHGG